MSWLDDDGDDDDLDYDEADIRVRPNPKANRPRTKRRPAHADAQTARVLGQGALTPEQGAALIADLAVPEVSA